MPKSFFLFTLCLTFLISLVLPSTSYAKWTNVSGNIRGDIYYVDFERIRKHDGYLFYWGLTDRTKIPVGGFLSEIYYNQIDCKVLREKSLSFSFHKKPMGEGVGVPVPISGKNKMWKYPPPNSVIEVVLKKVCNYSKDKNWKKMFKDDKGRTVYVDTKSIVKKGGHVFYSVLRNYSMQQGFESNNVSYRWLSSILYIKNDCFYFRYKILRKRFFERPTGNGKATIIDNNEQKWDFLTAKSYYYKPFIFSCKYAKNVLK